jgi:citronellol/citronellal dehydrogenase
MKSGLKGGIPPIRGGDPMADLKNKTLFVTGGSRGIGKAIALRAARDGANVVIAAKTAEPNPKLEGTIYTSAEEIEKAGGKALPLIVDIRHEDQVRAAVERGVEAFGGIDILVNNASAIFLAGVEDTPMKRFDLMHQVNVRGTFAASQACLPHLKKAENPHILVLSPPPKLDPKWFASHLAYTLSKYGMSMCVLGMSEEFKPLGIGVNALWPRTIIATAAVQNLLGGEASVKRSRKPEIMADAAHIVLTRASRETTGNFFVDEEVLASEGVNDLDGYALEPGVELIQDLFL